MELNILGEKWIISYENDDDNKILRTCDGYCDYSVRKIVLSDELGQEGNLADMQYYKKKVIRHEIIHAFLFESGLPKYGYDEELVEFLAMKFFKLNEIFEKLEVDK